jgi:hypothetical protein
MSPTYGTSKTHKRPSNIFKRLPGAMLASMTMLVMMACTNPPPFNSYDPPPTFAARLTVTGPGTMGGAVLAGTYQIDSISPRFVPLGETREFAGKTFTSGRWVTISGGRWPARWQFLSVGGCGQGTSVMVNIDSKLVELGCAATGGAVGVAPTGYRGDTPPPALGLKFNAAAEPPGTPLNIYIVDPRTDKVVSSASLIVDGNVSGRIPAPVLYDGNYYVVASDGAYGTLSIWGNPVGGYTGRYKIGKPGECYWEPRDSGPNQCTPRPAPTGRWKESGGRCYWDANDSGPNQCRP